MGGFKKVVRMLLDAGADVNDGEAGFSNALHEVSKNSDEETVRMLLDAGAIVDTETGEHGNALTVASWRGDEVVKILLNAKTRICLAHGNTKT
jgi:ankyrin repeat protein